MVLLLRRPVKNICTVCLFLCQETGIHALYVLPEARRGHEMLSLRVRKELLFAKKKETIRYRQRCVSSYTIEADT
jgi:hypothetical protein